MTRSQTYIPRSQTGILTNANGSLSESRNITVPICSPNALLIKVHSVALNPSDYKMPAQVKTANLVAGCDFAGEIVEVGSEVNCIEQADRGLWFVGDRVCGAVHGSNRSHPSWGSFAQYVEADPVVLTKFPDGWSWSDAASVGGSCVGAVGMALFHQMGLRLPSVDGTTNETVSIGPKKLSNVVLVYGGSTACGTMALQLLQLAGYQPITVCSPHNNALTKSYGAIACFDYHAEDCAQTIKAYTKNSLSLVIDCISTAKSVALCYGAIGRAGGRYVALEKLPSGVTEARRVVRYSWAMGPLMLGRSIDMGEYSFDPDNESREFGKQWYPLVELLLTQGKLKTHPVNILHSEEGWGQAVLKGLSTLKKNKVSGQKLVVNLE